MTQPQIIERVITLPDGSNAYRYHVEVDLTPFGNIVPPELVELCNGKRLWRSTEAA